MNTGKSALGVIVLTGLTGLLVQMSGQSTPATRPTASREQAPQNAAGEALTQGRKVFVERCGKCHGENGAAPLAGGPPLSERKLTDGQIEKNVRGRLKGSPEAEQRAVAAYIRSFQKKN